MLGVPGVAQRPRRRRARRRAWTLAQAAAKASSLSWMTTARTPLSSLRWGGDSWQWGAAQERSEASRTPAHARRDLERQVPRSHLNALYVRLSDAPVVTSMLTTRLRTARLQRGGLSGITLACMPGASFGCKCWTGCSK